MNRQERGFTLIEILVVISILGVLMALVSVLVIRAGAKKEELQTQQLVTAYLPNAIERYKQEFKRFPPMSMRQLGAITRYKGLVTDNETNESSEVLLVVLRHPDFSAPLGEGDLPTEEPFENTDDDIWNKVPDGSTDPAALEIVDAWGSPVVYIEKNHYDKAVIRIINAAGDEVEVTAVRRPDGATYYNPTSYQIISVGENGVQDSTEEPDLMDDVMNFKVRKEE
ncbi:MAG: type II secretion system protein [Planctomycetota bacterium]|jgi:prepilin-type N-terminal cleavage/methylation domain-containing protein